MTALKLALRLTVGAALLLGTVLLAAGRADFWGAWVWTGVVWATAVFTYLRLLAVSPGLVEERLKPPTDRDRATRRLVALPMLTHLLLAGVDARFGWSAVSLPLQLAALAVFGLGFALVGWTLLTNPFASSAVRIQTERKHQVISTGPYRLVRHPMYLAVVLVSASSGLAFGSWWASLPLLAVVAIFLRRTALEDRMLRAELEGYDAYASHVRWRVVPLVY